MKRLALLSLNAAIAATLVLGANAHAAVVGSQSVMFQGQTLKSGHVLSWLNWHLTLKTNGDLALTNAAGAAVWHTGTQNSGAKRLVFQTDGNLVLYTSTNKAVWQSHTDRLGLKNGSLQLSEGSSTIPGQCRQAGALHIYGDFPGNYSESVWTSCTLSTLNIGNAISRGSIMASPDGKTRFFYQNDGNLVLTGPNGVLWNSHTAGLTSTQFAIGAIHGWGPALYNGPALLGSTKPVWSTDSGNLSGSGYIWFAVQNDGNFVLYKSSDFAHQKNVKAMWSTNTAGK